MSSCIFWASDDLPSTIRRHSHRSRILLELAGDTMPRGSPLAKVYGLLSASLASSLSSSNRPDGHDARLNTIDRVQRSGIRPHDAADRDRQVGGSE